MTSSVMFIAENREFAGFLPAEQRFITRSLHLSRDVQAALKLWARDENEAYQIRAQAKNYSRLDELRQQIPHKFELSDTEVFLGPLTFISAFDLGCGKIKSFSAYRFLYERLLGAAIRPVLPSSFCAASAYPTIDPDDRRTLLQSLSEAAATAPGWSPAEPSVFPEWVDKVEVLR